MQGETYRQEGSSQGEAVRKSEAGRHGDEVKQAGQGSQTGMQVEAVRKESMQAGRGS